MEIKLYVHCIELQVEPASVSLLPCVAENVIILIIMSCRYTHRDDDGNDIGLYFPSDAAGRSSLPNRLFAVDRASGEHDPLGTTSVATKYAVSSAFSSTVFLRQFCLVGQYITNSCTYTNVIIHTHTQIPTCFRGYT